MTQTATVISVQDRTATVRIDRASACAGCHKNGECHECRLFDGEPFLTTDAENDVCAVTGDRVLIESGSRRILLYAFLTFFLPAFLAIAAYFASALLLPGTAVPTISFFAMLVIAFVFVKLFVDRMAKKDALPRIVRIL